MMPTARFMPAHGVPQETMWQGKKFLAGQAITVGEATVAQLPKDFVVERTEAERANGLQRRKRFERYGAKL